MVPLKALCFLLCCLPIVLSGKILVFPMEGSHWINMKVLIEGLHAKGHEVTVVKTATSWYIKDNSPHYRSITVTLPEKMIIENEDYVTSFLSRVWELQHQGAYLELVKFYWKQRSFLSLVHQQGSQIVVEMFENQTLMEELRDTGYDVVLMDPGLPGGVIMAHKLGLPTVFNVRFITSSDGHSAAAPSPLSYIPTSGCVASDHMTFSERIKNVLYYIVNACMDYFIVNPIYSEVVRQYVGPDVSYNHLIQGPHLWLIRTDFVLDFPRPTMPNIVYIGGFQCRPANPLPAELQEFVDGSEEHGVIVMSLGTMVQALPVYMTSKIAEAFAQLPQRIIWRYKGERPANLGNNTLLVEWFPQNDLLGHSKTRLFVSHGGANGIFEAIYHGVPMVGLPLFFDQFQNMLQLKTHGAVQVLDVTEMSSEDFLNALQQVLHDPSYRENMQRLSRLHRDRPMHPLDSAIYWIEFVMRHKGASHLRSESFKMPWFSYHSLDVAAFLLGVMLLFLGGGLLLIWFLCARLCTKAKPKTE